MDYVDAVSELNYMTQIVIMMYEDPTKVSHFVIKSHMLNYLKFSVGF